MGRVGPLALFALCVALVAADEDPNQQIEIIGAETVQGSGDPVPEGTNLQGQVFYDYTNYGNRKFTFLSLNYTAENFITSEKAKKY